MTCRIDPLAARRDYETAVHALVACHPDPRELPGFLALEREGATEVVFFERALFASERGAAELGRRIERTLSDARPSTFGLALPYWGDGRHRIEPQPLVPDGFTLLCACPDAHAVYAAPITAGPNGSVSLGEWETSRHSESPDRGKS